MPDDDVTWVDVRQQHVALTLADLLDPLTRAAALGAAPEGPAVDPQVLPQLAQLSALATQLQAVAAQVEGAQPGLLAPGGPAPA